MADVFQTIATTIAKFGRGYEDTLKRRNPISAMLEEDGRFLYNESGSYFTWNMSFQRATERPLSGVPLDFPAVQRWQQASLTYKGGYMPDSLYIKEKEENKGDEALINRYSEMGPQLYDDADRNVQQLWFKRGQATGNENALDGFESLFGQDGNSISATLGTAVGFAAGNYVVNPSDTYASISTTLGAFGGAVDGVWPNNFSCGTSGDTFDFNSPVMTAVNSTGFSAAGTWAAGGENAIRFSLSALAKDDPTGGVGRAVMLNRDYYRQLKTALGSSYQRYLADGRLPQLGFKDTIMIDGAEVTECFGMPAFTGYVFNPKHITYRSLFPKMFKVDGPTWHQQSASYRIALFRLGQMNFKSAKFVAKLYPYTGSSAEVGS